jgi:dynactin complex subunit
MAERGMKVGQKVELTGKDVRGEIVYIGNTHFASGKWIGVVLDSPKGKNNGSVQGKQYFQVKNVDN